VKPQVYKDERPVEYFTRFHERTRRGRPDLMYDVVRLVLTPLLVLLWRTRCIDSDKVPIEGPVIVAPNHFSFVDHFYTAVYLRRKVNFLAKSQLFKRPLQFVYSHGGVFPILRGRRDEEAFKTAHAVLARGDLIVMYAEGGRSRTGELGEAKPGLGRLALEAGAVVVPTAIVGSEKARNWRRLQIPKVTVQFGDPVRFDSVVENPTREQSQRASEMIFERTKEMHAKLAGADGRKRAVEAARAARRAGEATARRPATP